MISSTENIYNNFHKKLRAFVYSSVSDVDLTNDILQNVFLKIHSKINTLNDHNKLQSWIYRITRNEITDHFRKSKDVTTDNFDLYEAENEQESIEKKLSGSVKAMINSLPKKYRDALILTELLKMKNSDAASRLGITLGAFKSRVKRGRAELKKMLLECCHFEFDKRGKVLDYRSRCKCCKK